MAGDELGYLAIGILLGLLTGIPLGWLIAQATVPKGSVVKVERDEGGYSIVEKPLR